MKNIDAQFCFKTSSVESEIQIDFEKTNKILRFSFLFSHEQNEIDSFTQTDSFLTKINASFVRSVTT